MNLLQDWLIYILAVIFVPRRIDGEVNGPNIWEYITMIGKELIYFLQNFKKSFINIKRILKISLTFPTCPHKKNTMQFFLCFVCNDLELVEHVISCELCGGNALSNEKIDMCCVDCHTDLVCDSCSQDEGISFYENDQECHDAQYITRK